MKGRKTYIIEYSVDNQKKVFSYRTIKKAREVGLTLTIFEIVEYLNYLGIKTDIKLNKINKKRYSISYYENNKKMIYCNIFLKKVSKNL